MSTLVIILALAGLLGGLVLRLTASAQPATEPPRNHRGDTDAPRPPADSGSEFDPRAGTPGDARLAALEPLAPVEPVIQPEPPAASAPPPPDPPALGTSDADTANVDTPDPDAEFEPVGRASRGRHQAADESPRTPMWRRTLSLVELSVLVVVVGAGFAAAVGAVAVLVGSLLSSAI